MTWQHTADWGRNEHTYARTHAHAHTHTHTETWGVGVAKRKGGRRRREKEGWADEVQTGERRTKKIIDRARRKLDADQRECRKKRVLKRDKLWDLDQSPILEMRHLGLPAY